jgi:hypothetical protein
MLPRCLDPASPSAPLPDDLYIYKLAERRDIAGLEAAILSILRGIR